MERRGCQGLQFNRVINLPSPLFHSIFVGQLIPPPGKWRAKLCRKGRPATAATAATAATVEQGKQPSKSSDYPQPPPEPPGSARDGAFCIQLRYSYDSDGNLQREDVSPSPTGSSGASSLPRNAKSIPAFGASYAQQRPTTPAQMELLRCNFFSLLFYAQLSVSNPSQNYRLNFSFWLNSKVDRNFVAEVQQAIEEVPCTQSDDEGSISYFKLNVLPILH